MGEKSRTEYSAINTSAAMICRVLTILAGYLTRVVFTRMLSESYVGINGLFLDIINVLSFTELGVGTAITFALYKPVAEKDQEKQKSLMRLYQNIYRTVALIVLLAGLFVIPFMDVLIKNKPEVNHLTLIYLMYLANTALSYLFIYKRSLVDAHQKLYIGVLYQSGFLLLQYALQILVLVLTRNFLLYLTIYLLCTFGGNMAIARKADQLYPYLREKNVQPLPQQERQEITRNIRAMLMHKLGGTVVNNTDNLLLSSMVGIGSVACYSNYFLVIGSVRQVLNQMFQGITASVGNLGVIEDSKRLHRIFGASFFMGQWLYGFAAIALFELLGPFVELSFGGQYVFSRDITFILCVNFYVTGLRQATLVFRDSLGLFWYDRYKSVAEAAINLVSSIILARRFGTVGVFIGTLISTMTTSAWVEPLVLYRVRLKSSPWPYYGKYLVYSLVIFATARLTHQVCALVQGSAWRILLLRLPICLAVPNLVLLVCYHRTWEFRLLLHKALGLLRQKTRRKA